MIINKKLRTSPIVDFTVSADHRGKMKENEERDMYLDFARELIKLLNIYMTAIPTIICALGTVLKGLKRRMEE